MGNLDHLKLNIIKLYPKDKKDFFGKGQPTRFNYIVHRGKKARGYTTLGQLNKMLGTKYKVRSFKK